MFSSLGELVFNFTSNIFFFWQAPAGNSWLGSLIATIIGNLKISISNVHVRYEDSVRLVDVYSSGALGKIRHGFFIICMIVSDMLLYLFMLSVL